MPELPEVETISRTLDPLLRGRTITEFELFWDRTVERPPVAAFRAAVLNRRIEAVGRRAKLVVVRLDNGTTITIHLRMTGELLFRSNVDVGRPPAREPYLRARFAFAEGGELLFYDVRKFGRIALWDDNLALVDSRHGVEPLSDAFTADAFRTTLKSRKRQVKPLLLDQAVIAGLGNIYVDEALFRAGVHPLTRSADVDDQRAEALRKAIIDVLSASIGLGGTTFRDYRDGSGNTGSNQRELLVYGASAGTPCPRCGSPLERLVVGQRGTVLCPACQPLMPVAKASGR